MGIIIALIVLGLLLLVAELILLPGLSIAGIGALIAYAIAIYLGFKYYGGTGGVITIASIAVISVAGVILSLRAKTWQRLSLKQEIDSTSQPLPEAEIAIGEKGVTLTRLAPMGKISINGESYEAKSLGDVYVNPNTEIEIVGFENFSVIVKALDTQNN